MTSFSVDDLHQEILEIETDEIIEYFQKYQPLEVIMSKIGKYKNNILELAQHIHPFYDIYYQLYDISNHIRQFYESENSHTHHIISFYDEHQLWFIQIQKDIDYIWKYPNYISPCSSEDESQNVEDEDEMKIMNHES